MSSNSSVNEALADYAAGRMTAQQLVGVVAAEYYRDAGGVLRDALQPVMDVIERAHPGVVELAGAVERPGFVVKVAERPFPKRYEADLRTAVSAALETHPASRIPHPVSRPGLWKRVVRAVRRLFSA